MAACTPRASTWDCSTGRSDGQIVGLGQNQSNPKWIPVFKSTLRGSPDSEKFIVSGRSDGQIVGFGQNRCNPEWIPVF